MGILIRDQMVDGSALFRSLTPSRGFKSQNMGIFLVQFGSSPPYCFQFAIGKPIKSTRNSNFLCSHCRKIRCTTGNRLAALGNWHICRALGYEEESHCLPRDYELPNTETSDIFALGSTLYELVTGKAPYSELNETASDDPDYIKAQIRRQQINQVSISTYTSV
ncbi:hypothetical protein ACN38_g802 [Penicillium nordicum]|uniref:Protein kinase domain-containing protein n=1 Tax=Penicillium nordicum TaxID=229535 RepID=A0A0M9WKC9_9EURO|nr:hypothetical protein ACN38_g802 [Penicillium nordicum]